MISETFGAIQHVHDLAREKRLGQAGGVSVGNGLVIDAARALKSGEILQSNGDAFDSAQLFVALVGPEVAMRGGGVPKVTAWMKDQNGRRRRSFTVRGIEVTVESIDCDDALQEWFTRELATLAVSL